MSVTNGKIDKGNSITVEFSIAKPFWKTLWFMIVIVMIMIFIIGMIIRKILLRQKKEMQLLASKIKLERELDTSMLASIKSQMNPHFIFNALNTIQSYIYSNDKKSAGVYISKFSDLTRSILQMSNQDMITIAEEVNALQLYLSLEKMRFEDTFHYQIQVAETIDKEFCKIPSMLVQPYVENAIKHGLLHKKNNRQLLIHFSRTQNVLKIIVDDNGVGRKFSNELNQLKNRNHQSFAMNANKKRLEILQNLYGNIQFEIIDKFSDLNQAIGTTVIISMPYKL
jgi:LytS/YehU family sensor histidine kinase